MADISAATWSETDASNNSTSPAGFPEGMAPSGVNDSARMMMGAIKRAYDHGNAVITSGGTANAQTLTYTVAPTAYVRGDAYIFIVGVMNTSACSLNVNGLGARNIVIGTDAMVANELQVGQVAAVYYDASDRFQLLRPRKPATTVATPANPAGSASATGLMMGLAATITPTVSGEVSIRVVGYGSNNDAGAGGAFQVSIYTGTGGAPTAGQAIAGTLRGTVIIGDVSPANARVPFACEAVVTPLVLNTAYWIDLAVAAPGTIGTAAVYNLNIRAQESPR